MSKIRTLTVAGFRKHTRLTRVLKLKLDEHPFRYKAGQSAKIGVSGQEERKPFSIACSPESARRDGFLEFLIGLNPSAKLGPHLRSIRKGALVDLEGPIGSLRFPDQPRERHFLFVAGGTGIAPLRAMIQHVLFLRHYETVSVVYSVRSIEDFAFRAELQRLSNSRKIHFLLNVSGGSHQNLKSGQGRITIERLSPMVRDPATLCFLCGPPTMVADVSMILERLGISKKRIQREK